MDILDRLIICLERTAINNNKLDRQRLIEIEPLASDFMSYDEGFVTNLNELLSQDEKFNQQEYDLLFKFSKFSLNTKKYFLSMLTPQEKNFFDSIKSRIDKSVLSYSNDNTEIDVKKLIRKLKGRSNEFITDKEISYIMEAISDNETEQMKIEVLKYVNKINNDIFNKYDIKLENDDDALSEEDLIETNIKEEDLTNLLLLYNINLNDFDENKKQCC